MKILLLGKDGQVGHELQRTLLPLGEVLALGRGVADLSQPSTMTTVLGEYRPDVIVNAAAYTAVDKAESDEAAAFAVNAEALAVLAAYAAQHDALLVHYSTDYVFDGTRAEGSYVENDATAPQSVYGRSKRAGEMAILDSACKALILRTSWVVSSYGSNFIKTMLRLAKERDALNVVADQYGAPTSAELIADVTSFAILGHRDGKLASGIYHLTASGSTTWHGLASHVIARAASNGIALRVVASAISAIPSSAYPLPAKRPANSRMDNRKLQQALGLQFPDWTVHVNRIVDQLSEKEQA